MHPKPKAPEEPTTNDRTELERRLDLRTRELTEALAQQQDSESRLRLMLSGSEISRWAL